LSYDVLVVATGVKHSYVGHDDWRGFAAGLKTVQHAVEIRDRILKAFELAEITEDAERRRERAAVVVAVGWAPGDGLAVARGARRPPAARRRSGSTSPPAAARRSNAAGGWRCSRAARCRDIRRFSSSAIWRGSSTPKGAKCPASHRARFSRAATSPICCARG